MSQDAHKDSKSDGYVGKSITFESKLKKSPTKRTESLKRNKRGHKFIVLSFFAIQ